MLPADHPRRQQDRWSSERTLRAIFSSYFSFQPVSRLWVHTRVGTHKVYQKSPDSKPTVWWFAEGLTWRMQKAAIAAAQKPYFSLGKNLSVKISPGFIPSRM